MSITAISADFSQNPRTVRIESTDDFETITASGYLTAQADNIFALNAGAFDFLSNDLLLIDYDGGENWFKLSGTALLIVSENEVLHTQIDVDLADFIGSYTASVSLLPAPGANKKIILNRATLHINYGGTVLANGGAMHLQYADTANGAGTKATGTLAAATLIAATADTSFGFSPVDTTLVDSATLNKGLYIGTATADFTGGTDSTYKVDVWYSILNVA